LVDLLGADVWNERTTERKAMRSALDERLLRRTLYVARRPADTETGQCQ